MTDKVRFPNPPLVLKAHRGGQGRGHRAGVLLMHGLGGSPAELQPLTVELRAAGYAVSAPLIHGPGGGTDLDSETRWTDWVDTAKEHFDELAKTCDTVHVCGFCGGALLAPLVAIARREKAGDLILISPTFNPDGWAVPRTFQLFKLVKHRWFARLFTFNDREPYGIKDERVRTIVRQTLERSHGPEERFFEVSGIKMMEFNRLARAAAKSLVEVEARRTLVLHAREDDVSSLANAERVARKVPGRVEVRVIPDSFHEIILDKNRGMAIQSVLSFLRSGVEFVDQVAVPRQAG